MKRILAALKGKVEKQKMERKVASALRAIDSAKDNAQDAIDRIEEEKMKLLAEMADAPELNKIITKLSDKIGEAEEQSDIIKRLDKVRAFIEEDVEVDEEA